jgi:hypothetical protein
MHGKHLSQIFFPPKRRSIKWTPGRVGSKVGWEVHGQVKHGGKGDNPGKINKKSSAF